MALCLAFVNLFLQKGFDVFNALDLMENKTFLEKLKFGIGDGNLQYYLYNWKCPSMAPEKVSALGWWSPPAQPVHGKGSSPQLPALERTDECDSC